MKEVMLPINVAKLLACSELNAGIFSKKPLTQEQVTKEFLKYSDEFKKLFNKYSKKLKDWSAIVEFSHSVIDSIAKENLNKSILKTKPSVIETLKTTIFSFRAECEALNSEFKNSIDEDIRMLIVYETFLNSISVGYPVTKDTKKLKSELQLLRKKYQDTVDLATLSDAAEEILAPNAEHF